MNITDDVENISGTAPATFRDWCGDETEVPREIAEAALGHPVGLPKLAAPAEIVGRTPGGTALSAGTALALQR